VTDWEKEGAVSQTGAEPVSQSPTEKESPAWADTLGRLGTDWWATIVAGVITVLAVANVLPKIPW
jgi:uncharacterized RDD family membrane protein YckC